MGRRKGSKNKPKTHNRKAVDRFNAAVQPIQSKVSESLAQGSALAAQSTAETYADKPGTSSVDNTSLGLNAGTTDAGAVGNAPSISYSQVIHSINLYLTYKLPTYAMLPHEEQAIGEGLDLVIAKRWPGATQLGPEAALTVALMGYGLRVWSELGARQPAQPEQPAQESRSENESQSSDFADLEPYK